MRLKHLFFVVVAYGLFGCVKDKPQPVSTPIAITTGNESCLITCEGNYGSANASLSHWNETTATLVEDVYKAANHASCGDVLQSIVKKGTVYYLVVNNSGKVLVCDAGFKKQKEITGLQSPRYFLGVSPAKAYVSDLYANAISVVDLNSNTVIGKIACKGWSERMVMLYNTVFVTNVTSNYLYVINAISDRIIDSVNVGKNAAGIVLDREDKIWVLLRSESAAGSSKLVRIDAVTRKILAAISVEGSAFDLQIDAAAENLFFINGGVQKLSIAGDTPVKIVVGSGTYYGLGINPANGNIYLADAKDYTQQSLITVYKSDGTSITSFRAGINANGFYFE